MTAKFDAHNDFVDGIHNYCDRWCERCNMTSRCLLYSMESTRRAENIANGKEPNDIHTVLNDVQLTLKQTKELLMQEVTSRGIELEELEEEEIRIDTSVHPLHVFARSLSFGIHHFREQLGNIIKEEREKETRGDHLHALEDSFEILAWYEFQFFVKIQRALPPIITNSMDEFELYDANGSAKVAWIGLTKSLDALTRIAEILPWIHQSVLPLLNQTYQLIDLLDRTIPGHKNFKRPGFDD